MKAVLVSVALLAIPEDELSILLLREPGTVWGLPGTPLPEGERLVATAEAALRTRAGVSGVSLEQLYTLDGAPGEEPVQVAYLGLTRAGRHTLAPGEGVVDAAWFALSDLPALGPGAGAAVALARTRVQAKAAYSPVVMDLLPATFTLGELQAAYETALAAPLDTRNFRRDVVAAGIVEDVGRTRAEGPGRPARLYRARPGSFAVDAGERRALRAIEEALATPADGGEKPA